MKFFTWDQINNWRLFKHGLVAAENTNVSSAIENVFALQAQVLSASELGIFSRFNNLTRDKFKKELYENHTIIKTWAMRGTLHLLSINDYPLFVAARSTYDFHNWKNYFEFYGIRSKKFQDYLNFAGDILSEKPITREQFAKGIAKKINEPKLESLIISKGWGSPLKPVAWSGNLAFGPNIGQNVTFIYPKRFIKNWQNWDPQEAMQEVLRRYFKTHVISNPREFSNWWNGSGGLVHSRKLFSTISQELAEIDVEGNQYFILKNSLQELDKHQFKESVKLLPLFDTFTFGQPRKGELEKIFPGKFHKLVFRPQGWISATVVINGKVRGVWDYKIKGNKLKVNINMFEKVSQKLKKEIKNEIDRLSNYLNLAPQIRY